MIKKLNDYWFSLSDKIRFLFVGGFNFCFAYLLFVLFTFLFGKQFYQQVLILSWILSSFVSFSTQRYFVFQSDGPIVKEYFKCFTSWMISYAINAILLEFNVKILHLDVLLSQIIANLTAAIATYIMFKYFAFKQQSS